MIVMMICRRDYKNDKYNNNIDNYNNNHDYNNKDSEDNKTSNEIGNKKRQRNMFDVWALYKISNTSDQSCILSEYIVSILCFTWGKYTVYLQRHGFFVSEGDLESIQWLQK